MTSKQPPAQKMPRGLAEAPIADGITIVTGVVQDGPIIGIALTDDDNRCLSVLGPLDHAGAESLIAQLQAAADDMRPLFEKSPAWSVEWTEAGWAYMGVWTSSKGEVVADCHLFVMRPAGEVTDWRWEVKTSNATLEGRGHRTKQEAQLFCRDVSEAYWRLRTRCLNGRSVDGHARPL